jgi:benzoyl-CoA 2,3-dioxygenase component B
VGQRELRPVRQRGFVERGEAFASGLKGRYREGDGIYKDPKALDQIYETQTVADGGRLSRTEIPLRRAMNALLLDAYFADITRIVARWNKTLSDVGVEASILVPSLRFNRQMGLYGGMSFDLEGNLIPREEFDRKLPGWLPSQADYDYVASCMVKVHERGKFANWIAPPHQGINNQPIDFEYVKFH